MRLNTDESVLVGGSAHCTIFSTLANQRIDTRDEIAATPKIGPRTKHKNFVTNRLLIS